MKKIINSSYTYPWLIMMVLCSVVLAMLAVVLDFDKLSRMWWIVPAGGAIAAAVCNLLEFFISRNDKIKTS